MKNIQPNPGAYAPSYFLSPLRGSKKRLAADDVPRGFRFSTAACGLRKTGGLDLALITSDAPCAAAAVFTQNLVQAAPVQLSRQHVKRAAARMRAIIVNAGNANCSTGAVGMQASRATAARVARELGCAPEQIIVCSTGVIGVPLRVERILRAVPALARAQAAAPRAYGKLTRAIMTTDTRPKWAAARARIAGKTVRLLGCAKGAGMIHPNMATMLAFVVTDAAIAPALLRRALGDAAARTFNCITVDGDTSTNDTLAVLASGASARVGATLGSPSLRSRTGRASPAPTDYTRFAAALESICRSLALQIVADGEGARRVVEIEVRNAASARAADSIARTIANSPLVKTALAGGDPNWGRILAAAGRAPLAPRERFDPDACRVWLAGTQVYSRGRALPFSERAVSRRMLRKFVSIVLELGLRDGKHGACIWTCDFTHDYVTINANYRT